MIAKDKCSWFISSQDQNRNQEEELERDRCF